MLAKKVISDYHKYIVFVLKIYSKSLYKIIIMSMTKYICKFFQKPSKERELSDHSKACEDPKKMTEDESSTGSSKDINYQMFYENKNG